jgi:tryptophanyl-tRNA synthetase
MNLVKIKLKTMNKRIFSGVQPSGNLHIGNYLGAIKNWVKLQNDYDSIFCVVDLHAITVPQNPEELQKKILEIAKIYLACGINPKKSAVFIQSHVQEHAELAWILNTITKMPELDKMTQFKDKTQSGGRESSGVGLFDYPVLMAADIILYDTEKVPVGEDQVQHVELTRTLAKRFNAKFGETFVIPEPLLVKESCRIMGLDDPSKKMSKSAASEYNWIALTDDAETIQKKIKKAVTDSGSEIKYQDEKPALKNLINIYAGFSDKSPKEIEKMYAGKGYADFKKDLAEIIITGLNPIQEKMQSLSDEEVLEILKSGADKVRSLAQKKMKEVKEKIGFVL